MKGKDHIGKVGTDSKVAAAGVPLQSGIRGVCHPVPLPSSRSGSTTAPEGHHGSGSPFRATSRVMGNSLLPKSPLYQHQDTPMFALQQGWDPRQCCPMCCSVAFPSLPPNLWSPWRHFEQLEAPGSGQKVLGNTETAAEQSWWCTRLVLTRDSSLGKQL